MPIVMMGVGESGSVHPPLSLPLEQSVHIDFSPCADVHLPVHDCGHGELHCIPRLIAISRCLRTVPQLVDKIGGIIGMQNSRSLTAWAGGSIPAGINRPSDPVRVSL